MDIERGDSTSRPMPPMVPYQEINTSRESNKNLASNGGNAGKTIQVIRTGSEGSRSVGELIEDKKCCGYQCTPKRLANIGLVAFVIIVAAVVTLGILIRENKRKTG